MASQCPLGFSPPLSQAARPRRARRSQGHLCPAQPASWGKAHQEPCSDSPPSTHPAPPTDCCRAGPQGTRVTLLLPRPTRAKYPQSLELATSPTQGRGSNGGPAGKCGRQSVVWGLPRPSSPASAGRQDRLPHRAAAQLCRGHLSPLRGMPQTEPIQTPQAPWALPQLHGKLGPTGVGATLGSQAVLGNMPPRPHSRNARAPPGGPAYPSDTLLTSFGQVWMQGYAGGGDGGHSWQSWGTTGLDPGSPHSSCSPQAPCTLAALLGLGWGWGRSGSLGQVCRNVTCLGWGRASESFLSCAGPRQMEPV